ncbi:MAG: hypothetical protein V2I45_04805 [Halieaceae bacterium]|nr:hypothetical protein [Halieaceae bacterium]
MKWLVRFVRRSFFVVAVLVFLVGAAITSTLWALQLSTQIAIMGANAAAAAVQHRKEVARAVARTKAKARLRRLIAAVPVLGVGAIIYYEDQDYEEWLKENPDGKRGDYACEVSHFSAEVVDEVLAALPESVRPKPDTVLGLMPACSDPNFSNDIIAAD